MLDNFWNFQRGGGVTASSLKWKIRRGGGVLYDIPSVVGVWIFSGTTQFHGRSRHRGNTFFDVTVTGQWSSPSVCLPSILPSIDR